MKNIKDLKQNEVIKCETKQEWDAVCEMIDYRGKYEYLQQTAYGKICCLSANTKQGYSEENATRQLGLKVLPASDFLPQKTADLTGCWVKCIDNKGTSRLTPDKWYQIIECEKVGDDCYFKTICDSGWTHCFSSSRFDLTDPRKENPDEVKPEIDFTKFSAGEFEPTMEDKIKMVENMIQVEWLKDYDKARLEMAKEFVKGKVGEI